MTSREQINKDAGRLHELAQQVLGIDWYDTESQARRVLEAMHQREQWQPMDTVPRDGTPVLVLLEQEKETPTSRREECLVQHGQFFEKTAVIGNFFHFDMPKAIGWMPPPEVPA